MNRGRLFLVGTPIGNREDMTWRALRVLFSVEVILCEDTRATKKLLGLYEDDLLKALGIERRMARLERFDEVVERKKTPQVIEWLKQGRQIALVSKAGMPLISDPGFVLVREVIRQAQGELEGVEVEVVPGPSALTAAIARGGLSVDQVLFLGFLPKKKGKRDKVWQGLRQMRDQGGVRPTVVIFESPYRLLKTVKEVEEELGDPEVALGGELTKVYEKVWRGKASRVKGLISGKVRGEWVILVSLREKKV
jgi:16S rRNA (cytidine1402-2'-O)-methyltransferase